ncbi:MAG TPA: metallophosphoesterase [Pseudolabrys sp.]|jgi:predicted MPP superfamily phosphohydrolase|nr:metallophosphoesterase [Pseudolabrys sp.]
MSLGNPVTFAGSAWRPGLTRRGLLRAGIGVGGLVLPGAGAYAAIEAADDLVITDYRLTPPGWPKGQRLTITVVADLHAGGPNMGLARVKQVTDAAIAAGGDLVVIMGDYFATHRFVTERVPHAAWAAELARLQAPLGVYAILGNHDWWYDIVGVRKALAAERIAVLENDALCLGAPGRRFWLAGLGDQLAHYLGPGQFRGVDDLPGTLKQVRTSDPVILLAHEPDIFVDVSERVSLTIAGHTHGGQLRVPFMPPVWAPSRYGARFAYGHIVETGRHMIVSGGLGCSKVPLRLGVPPEIVRITLG